LGEGGNHDDNGERESIAVSYSKSFVEGGPGPQWGEGSITKTYKGQKKTDDQIGGNLTEKVRKEKKPRGRKKEKTLNQQGGKKSARAGRTAKKKLGSDVGPKGEELEGEKRVNDSRLEEWYLLKTTGRERKGY